MDDSKKEYSISEFKAKSLRLFERVSKTGCPILVTKHGKPIARVVPFKEDADCPVPGRLSGTILDEKDIISALGPELWKSAK